MPSGRSKHQPFACLERSRLPNRLGFSDLERSRSTPADASAVLKAQDCQTGVRLAILKGQDRRTDELLRDLKALRRQNDGRSSISKVQESQTDSRSSVSNGPDCRPNGLPQVLKASRRRTTSRLAHLNVQDWGPDECLGDVKILGRGTVALESSGKGRSRRRVAWLRLRRDARACRGVTRKLGQGGSSSRIARSSSAIAACFSRSFDSGVVPVSNS